MAPLSEQAAPRDKSSRQLVPWFALLILAGGCSGTPPKPPPEPVATLDAEVRADAAVETSPGVSAQACALEPTWPMFQGDTRRTGVADAPAIDTPSVKWATRVGVQSWNNNPIVLGDLVVVGSSGDVWNKPDPADGVYALHRETGELAWFLGFDDDVNGVAAAGCRIIAGSDDGTVRGIDPITGEEAWSREMGGKVYSQPLPMPGGVLVTSVDGRAHLLDPITGETVWSADAPNYVRQGGAWDGESIWLAGIDGEVWRLDREGSPIWRGRVPDGRAVWGAPTITDRGPVIGFVRDTTYPTPALTGFTFDGAPLWSELDPGTRNNWANVRTSPAYTEGLLVHAEAYGNELIFTDPARGLVVGSTELGPCMFPQWSSPLVVGERVIIARHDGTLYAVDPATRKPLWGISPRAGEAAQVRKPSELNAGIARQCRWSIPSQASFFATPASDASGTIYVGSGSGWLYAIADSEAGSSAGRSGHDREGK